jgi:hypothetical protein
MSIIRLPHTKEMIQEAHEWSLALGSLNNSITKGAANKAARIAELSLAKHLGVSKPSDDYNHDILFKQEKIEVKTKRRTVKPKPFYDVSVAKTSDHQKPDRYAFLSLEFETSVGRGTRKKYLRLKNVWYCGDISHQDFWSKAELWEKGRVDKSNNFHTHVDMYNMRISDLENKLVHE